MPVGVVDFGSIVSAVINTEYSSDRMQAVINNYLIGSDKESFNKMQEYRNYAKKVAANVTADIKKGKGIE